VGYRFKALAEFQQYYKAPPHLRAEVKCHTYNVLGEWVEHHRYSFDAGWFTNAYYNMVESPVSQRLIVTHDMQNPRLTTYDCPRNWFLA
jgi:hypothetical protein